jgi:flagellar export protein FliJ
MAKARFSSVLTVEEQRLDTIRGQLAEITRRQDNAARHLEGLGQRRADAAQRLAPGLHEQFARFSHVINHQQGLVRREQAQLAKADAALRAELLNQHQRVRSLRLIQERDRRAAQKRADKQAAAAADEHALRRWLEEQQG